MSTTNMNSGQGIPPLVVPPVASSKPTDSAEKKYPLGVTEEEVQVALKRREAGGKRWTTAEVLEQLKALDAK